MGFPGLAARIGLALGVACLAVGARPAAADPGAGRSFESAALTLENARPLAIPPRPNLRAPAPIKAPPRFTTPDVMEAPEPPRLTIGPAPSERAAAPGTALPPGTGNTGTQVPGTNQAADQGPAPAGPNTSSADSTQTAALPPNAPAAPTPSAALNIVFDAGSSALPSGVESTAESIAERMRASQSARLELRAYAAGTEETAREARQLSLARALALRERLETLGVPRNRVGVRALGIASGGGSPDRVDIDFLNE